MAVSKTAQAAQDAIKSNGSRTTAEDVEDRIEELRKEIAELSKTLAAFGATKVDDYKAGLDRLASDAIATSAKAFETARAEASSLEANIEDQIRSKPWHAMGIAVGIGFLAAILTRR